MYKEEYSSSVYLPCKDNDLVNKTKDMAKKKKSSFTVVKHSLMKLKTTKQEVYVFHDDQDSSPQLINSSTDSSSYIQPDTCPRSHVKTDEKIKTLRSPEINQHYPVDSVIQDTTNFQTLQSKQFVRNYLKTKAGSTGELCSTNPEEDMVEQTNDIHSDSNGNNFNTNASENNIHLTATAIKDCVPSPYDHEALAFKKGDTIKVTSMNTNGIWRGHCNGKVGNFKFIDVKMVSSLRNQATKFKSHMAGSKSKSVSDLLTAIHLENLTSVFVLNGYDTTDDIKHISVDDLDYLGIDDSVKDTILQSVDKLRNDPVPSLTEVKIQDSGFSSSSGSDISGSYFLPTRSYLYPNGK